MALAATFRLLYSSDASLQRKVEAAEELVTTLLDGSQAEATAATEADVAALPPLVRAHYLRSLLDWSCAALTKKAGAPPASGDGGGKPAKKRKQQQAQQADGSHAAAELRPRCWAVLTAVLGSSSTAASQPLPAALLPAATTAMQGLQEGAQSGQQGTQLLAQLAALLGLLHGKFAGGFRPSIEHAAAAVEAALTGHAAAAAGEGQQQAWEPVAVAAVRLLLAAAAGHPNQRKVWDAAVPRLLPLLAQAAFPALTSSSTGSGELPACCRQLLGMLLFHHQHVAALAEAAAAEMAAAVAEASATGKDAGQPDSGEAALSHQQQRQGGSYAVQLFVTMRAQVAAAQLPLPLLPWMAGQFCAALRQHRRAAETEAAITSQAGHRNQPQQQHTEEAGGQEGGIGASTISTSRPLAAASVGGGISVSGDFHFWLALLRTLMPHVQQLAEEQAAASSQLADAVSGVALLAACLRQHQLYRPTQDPAAHQRLLLQQLADTALLLAQQQQQQQHDRGAEVVPATLGVLRGILAVEHRVIQQQLPLLWPLLLWSPDTAPTGSRPYGGCGSQAHVAVDVACSLVSAFAELRQLGVLLRSLMAALQQQPGGVAPRGPATAVLHSGRFRAALAAAVQGVPSGQVPRLVQLAAEAVQQLAGSGGAQAGHVAAADLCCCCLDSLHIDLTTAGAAATAAQVLVAALARPLLPLLQASGGSGSSKGKEKTQGELLPALLQLYRRALAVHAHCAALHPEVVALAGQHVQRQTSSHPDSPTGTSIGGSEGYFAPLQRSTGSDSSAATSACAPQLADMLEAADTSSSLGTALLQAAEQRLAVLHTRHQYLTHTCPVTLLPSAQEQADQPANGQAQPQAQQQQEEERERVVSELQQLATCIAAAASKDAAGGSNNSSSSCAAMQVAVRVLPLVQEWSAEAPLLALLQASLRQAAALVASSADGDGHNTLQHQQLCRQLLLGGELLEQRRLVVLLPAAVAVELGTALRTAFVVPGKPQQEGEEMGSKQKKRKKSGQESTALEGGGGGGQLAALLQQLERVAGGKEPKAKAWAAAVEDSCSSIAGLAAGNGNVGAGGQGKKRKQSAVEDGSSGAAAAGDGLLAVQRQVTLLAELPLRHLPAEAAARMAAVATSSVLCCWQGSLALVQAGSAGDQEHGVAASCALSASTACLALLAPLVEGSRGGSHLSHQLELLPEVLQAALVAAGSVASMAASSTGSSAAQVLHQSQTAAEHSGRVMQAVCSGRLAAGSSSALQLNVQQLSQQLLSQEPQQHQQWAASVLAQACLATCYAAACRGEDGVSGSRAGEDLLCPSSSSSHLQLDAGGAALVGGVAAQLDTAIAAALPPAAAAVAAAASTDSWQPALLAASLYRSAALLLRLRCCDHPAAEALEKHQAGGDSTSSSCVSMLAASLHAAAGLLTQQRLSAAGAGLLEPALLEYVAAACCLAGRMRPAASNSHYASLLALLLHLLAAQQPEGAADPGGIPPTRHIIPFAAAFPAAAAAALAAHSIADVGGSSTTVRPLLLEALRELVAGSSSQQLLLPLRFVEAYLPAADSGMALPLCECLLALLEAGSGGNRQQRLLGQHSERMVALLTGFIDAAAYGSSLPVWQQQEQRPVPSLPQLAAAILAAGEGGSSDGNAPAAAPATPPMHASGEPAPAAPSPRAAEVAALCTALRALESLAARPKLFYLPASAASSMLSSVTAVWTAYAEQPPQQRQQELASRGAAAPLLPGFCFRLGTSGAAGLYSSSCHLLLAMLRHRQQELRRCLPLLLQAVRALLRFLVACELSAKLQQQLPGLSHAVGTAPVQAARRREHGWRVKCAELLAAVMAELAGLKEVGIGRYCPQLLADYLVLAAAPPSAKSAALLQFSSPAAALAGSGDAADSSSCTLPAAAAGVAEEDVLAGEPLPDDAAAALRQGAFALYGACSATEIQFLYASLGGAAAGGSGQRGGAGAAASWRAALSALKGEYERSGRYSGKV